MNDTPLRQLRALAQRTRPTRPTASTPITAEDPAVQPRGLGMIDSALYVDGDRVSSPTTLADTFAELHARDDAIAWIGLYRPDQDELASLASEFNLHELAVEDAIVAHQRPKLERYDDTLFVVLRAARYIDQTETVEFGEVHLFIGPDFVISVRHAEKPELAAVRRRMESSPDLLRLGTEAILYAILDRVVDGYLPVVDGLENDIDEIETEVFSGDPEVSRRIYQLSREVIEFQRATHPLAGMFAALRAGVGQDEVDEELVRHLRDVEDHLLLVIERVNGFRQLLRDMLTVNATLVAQKQNEEMTALSEASNSQGEEVKRISAWAAILFAPSLVGGVYGMNFDFMPETHWAFGYPMALGLMFLVSLVLYLVFKGRRWL